MKPFACWIRTKKPFVTLKSALTLDGQLALPKSQRHKRRIWITSEESRAEVQRMRHISDALVTGIGTILADDPLLTDRSGLPRRKRLLRVILDTKLRPAAEVAIVQTQTTISWSSPQRRSIRQKRASYKRKASTSYVQGKGAAAST